MKIYFYFVKIYFRLLIRHEMTPCTRQGVKVPFIAKTSLQSPILSHIKKTGFDCCTVAGSVLRIGVKCGDLNLCDLSKLDELQIQFSNWTGRSASKPCTDYGHSPRLTVSERKGKEMLGFTSTVTIKAY